MARLEALNGWLTLRPLSYEFPARIETEWDDWLYVEFEAKLEKLRVSRRSAPVFLSFELDSFIRSAEGLAQRRAEVATLSGLELSLQIEARRSGHNISVEVSVAHEFAPILREPFDDPFVGTASVSSSAFERFIAELAAELKPFPPRFR